MSEAPHAALADRFRADPGRAQVAIRVATELEEGPALRGHRPRPHRVLRRAALGGRRRLRPEPGRAVRSTSLATCQAITYRIWAAELGIALDRIEVEVVGDIDLRGLLGVDDAEPAGYQKLTLRVSLTGPEPERYEELAEAVDRHCPVLGRPHAPAAGRARSCCSKASRS